MESIADISNMFLRMCVTEDNLVSGSHTAQDVNREMPADIPITVSSVGEVQNAVTNFVVDPSWVEANLKVVPFIQDDDDHKVHATTSTKPDPDYAIRYYSLGERQVVGLAMNTHAYDDFRVYNLGNLGDTYTVTLTSNMPVGWSTELWDDTMSQGASYSQYLNPGEYFDLHVELTAGDTGYGRVGVEMTQDNVPSDWIRTLNYAYFTDDLDVLLVDDDGAEEFEEYFKDALEYIGRSYGVWDRNSSAVGSSVLNYFPVVIWNVGWAFPTFDEGDRAALSDYLDGGGKLFATGQDIGWELNDIGGAAYQWYQDYLHALFRGDDTNMYNLHGVDGDPISDGIDLVIQGGDGAGNQEYPSDIDPADGSASVIWTYDAYRNGAIKADTGVYRVVYLAFGYEAINNADDRRMSMLRIVNWLMHGAADAEDSEAQFRAFFSSSPNPISAAATLRFTLPSAGAASLKVYGPDGRLARTLVDGTLDAGNHMMAWDRTDSRGNRLPAGVYYYSLQAEGVDFTRNVVLLK
jgi:hypothetical protein